MIADKMRDMVEKGSQIRAMFEEGNKMAQIYGKENVYDFSLGNPNLPAPKEVKEAIIETLEEDPVALHGYNSSNAGFEDVREAVASHINKQQGTSFKAENIIMTSGAAMAMNVILKVVLNKDDEVVVFAPYFGEYRSYVANYDGVIVESLVDATTFLPNLEDFKKKITRKTKVVIVNSPNNPSGVIYDEEVIKALAQIMTDKEKEFGHDILLLSDEPYREIVYGNKEVPYVTKYYKNTAVSYSYSKSLSLPGERIGYLVISNEMKEASEMSRAASIANRILGSVNAPTLQQKMIKKCLDVKTDVAFYEKNRDTLYKGLLKMGYDCVKPEGAFYLFMKSPVADEKKFCDKAKEYHLLMVPGSSFSYPGYVRIAYCVSYETIVNALPKFAQLAKDYDLLGR